MIKANPLFDIDFLTKLTVKKQREVYARITALTLDERPVEQIEGKVTQGSVNIDGASAVRRTCNLTMVAQDVNINEFYWGFKNKFTLDVGLKNTIDARYPDIIWFKQGMFIITSFSVSQSTNNFTITINGKDKMCLLNGDIAGSLPHSVDFGVEEYYDKETKVVTYNEIPIKDIIRNAVQCFGNELPQNIIVNDLDTLGMELLEYRGNTPMYMFKAENSNDITQMTMNGAQKCYVDGEEKRVDSSDIIYDNLVDIAEEDKSPTPVTFSEAEKAQKYTIAKFEYGHNAGYRSTELTYAGDLIANIGETIVSVLDKIKNMLGEFEYFYNVDGKFVFQKKQNYLQTTWHIGENNPEIQVDNAINTSFPIFSFLDAELITAFGNNPNILNVKNDFSVWGTFKSISGADIPIHMRLALDTKPTSYFPIRSIWSRKVDSTAEPPKDYVYYHDLEILTDRHYIDKDGVEMIGSYFNQPFTSDKWDWRELIYQMALDWRKHNTDDDFLLEIAAVNPQYPTGKTGYEQYYIDLEGFWRELYDPNPERETIDIEVNQIPYIDKERESILIKYPFVQFTDYPLLKREVAKELFILNDGMMIPLLKSNNFKLEAITYYYKANGEMNDGTDNVDLLKNIDKLELYTTKNDADEKLFITLEALNNFIVKNENNIFIKSKNSLALGSIDKRIQNLYYSDGVYKRVAPYTSYDNYGKQSEIDYNHILCYEKSYSTFDPDTYWSKTIYEAPETLLFWFDFLDVEGSDLAKFSVPVIGSRTKSINDSNVKNIYYREIPNVMFYIGDEFTSNNTRPTGYTHIQIPKEMQDLFSISSKGKSAQERIDELLQTHSYCVENTNITTVPVYHLEPNSRIYVRDDKSGANGEYIVTKLTIPLAYNGTMSLTTNKVVSNIM